MSPTRVRIAAHTLKGYPHSFTKPTMDARYMKCSIIPCDATWKIPEREAPSQPTRTSEEAAVRIKESGASHVQRVAVFQAFQQAGARGLTDGEGQEVTGLGGDSYRPRRVELHRDNLIVDSHLTRKTAANREAIVWQVRGD